MTRRTNRIAESVRRKASEVLQRELKDPRTEALITITKVEVTPDLRLAKIYYSVLGDGKTKRLVEKGLRSARSFIRTQIAEELKLRYAPDIRLMYDETAAYTERINELLEKVKKETENENNRKDKESN